MVENVGFHLSCLLVQAFWEVCIPLRILSSQPISTRQPLNLDSLRVKIAKFSSRLGGLPVSGALRWSEACTPVAGFSRVLLVHTAKTSLHSAREGRVLFVSGNGGSRPKLVKSPHPSSGGADCNVNRLRGELPIVGVREGGFASG